MTDSSRISRGRQGTSSFSDPSSQAALSLPNHQRDKIQHANFDELGITQPGHWREVLKLTYEGDGTPIPRPVQANRDGIEWVPENDWPDDDETDDEEPRQRGQLGYSLRNNSIRLWSPGPL